jgi:hypothetical protein
MIEVVHAIVTEAPFRQHAAALTTTAKEQAAVVAPLLRHCLPHLTAAGTEGAASSATTSDNGSALSLESTLGCMAQMGAALGADSLRSGLQAELARPGSALITARQLQLALAALPTQPPPSVPAGVWREAQVRLTELLYVPTPGSSAVGGVQPGSAVATQFCSELWDQVILLVKASGNAPQLAATLSRCGFAQLVYRVIQHTCAAGDEQHVKLVRICGAPAQLIHFCYHCLVSASCMSNTSEDGWG